MLFFEFVNRKTICLDDFPFWTVLRMATTKPDIF